MAQPIEMPFGLRTHMGTRNHVLDGDPDPQGKGNFEGGGEGAAHCKVYKHSAVSCAKMSKPIKMPFGLTILVGPRNHACIR